MFPFRDDGTGRNKVESRHVEWIREHASYLTLGNVSTKAGSFAEYALGLPRNLSVIFPGLLLLSIGLGYSHFWFIRNPIKAILLVGITIGFALVVINALIVKSSETYGSIFNNGYRALWSKSLGWLSIGFTVAAFAVTSAFLLEKGRDLFRHEVLSPLKILVLLIVSYTISHTAVNYSPISKIAKRFVKTFLYGFFGGISLWIVLLTLNNLFVYGNPLAWIGILTNYPHLYNYPEIAVIGCPLAGLAIVGLLILLCRVHNRSHHDEISHVASSVLFIVPSLIYWALFFYPAFKSQNKKQADTNIGLLATVRLGIGDFTRQFGPITSTSINFQVSDSSIETHIKLLRTLRRELDILFEKMPYTQPDTEDARAALTPWAIDYFGATLRYADAGFELASADENGIFNFWQELVKVNRQVLIDLAEKRAKAANETDTNTLLLSAIAEAFIFWTQGTQTYEKDNCFNAIKEQFIESLSENSVLAIISQLSRIGPSAIKQTEFAELVDREEDLTSSTKIIPLNSLSPGSITYLDGKFLQESNDSSPAMSSTKLEQLKKSVKRGLINKTLKLLDSNRLDDFISNDEIICKIYENTDSEFAHTLPLRAKLARIRIKELCQIIDATNHQSALKLLGIDESKNLLNFINDKNKYIKQLATSELIQRIWTLNFQDIKTYLNSNTQPSIGVTNNFNQLYVNPRIFREEERKSWIKIFYENEWNLWKDKIRSLARKPIGSGSTDDRIKNYSQPLGESFSYRDLLNLAIAGLRPAAMEPDAYLNADRAVTEFVTGRANEFNYFINGRYELFKFVAPIKVRVFLISAILIGFFAFVFVEINTTSIHGFYRDRLSKAFFLSPTSRRDHTSLENIRSIRLSELNCENSIGPYHLINTSINLQRSTSLRLRDQRCDSFIFSKLFCGSLITEYVATKDFQIVDPTLNLATAMTISAAAASPNMGRFSNPFATFLMAILNVRLGYWVPNPKRLNYSQYDFDAVFREEWKSQVIPRWIRLNDPRSKVFVAEDSNEINVSAERKLIGVSFSGGGIRSAAFCMGISQGMDSANWFPLVDYLSTVSGGGYTGSAISAAMGSLSTNDNVEKRFNDLNCRWPYARSSRNPVSNFWKEMISFLHENSSWINLSDGGHLENLGVIELLRRRCRLIIICDAEADPEHNLNGLGTLIRLARFELGCEIIIDTSAIRISAIDANKGQKQCMKHWTIGQIKYIDDDIGYIIYLKSSLDGKDPENLRQYQGLNPEFPQEPTLDQFFSIEQFDSYRELGLHVFSSMISELSRVGTRSLPEQPTAEDLIIFAETLFSAPS